MPQVIQRVSMWRYVLIGTILATLPALIALVTLLRGNHWYPAGDMAQAELHMRGFFDHPPLVGAAGRIVDDNGLQGSHPGPGLWVAMLPVYLLGGRSSGALMAAVVSVHIASVATALWLAIRRGGKLFGGLIAIFCLAIMRASGPDFMIEPWNPWLAVLPFLVFVFLIGESISSSSTNRTRLRFLVGSVVVGSYCIQCHAGYVLLVGGAVVAALLTMLLGERNSADRLGKTTKAIGSTAGVFVLVWLPVLIDQWRRTPGNLTVLWQHFGSPSEPTIPLRDAVRVIATQMNVFGPWLTGPGAHAPSESWARYIGCFVFVALWVGATLVASRQRERVMLRWQMMLAGFLALGMLSILRIFGPYFEYTVRWFWILAGFTLAHSLLVLIRLTSGRSALPFIQQTKIVLLGSVLIATGVFASAVQAHDQAHLPGPTDSSIVGQLVPQALTRLESDKKYLLRMYDPYTLNATGFGSVLELERQGIHVGVEWFQAAAALPHRVMSENEADEILWVVVGPAISRANVDPTLTRIAYVNPRTAAEEAHAQQLLQDIAAGLIASGREDLVAALDTPGASLIFAEPPLPIDLAEMVKDLILLGQPVAMYSATPGVQVPSLEPDASLE